MTYTLCMFIYIFFKATSILASWWCAYDLWQMKSVWCVCYVYELWSRDTFNFMCHESHRVTLTCHFSSEENYHIYRPRKRFLLHPNFKQNETLSNILEIEKKNWCSFRNQLHIQRLNFKRCQWIGKKKLLCTISKLELMSQCICSFWKFILVQKKIKHKVVTFYKF